MKKIIIVIAIALLPSIAAADSGWKLLENKNTVIIEGVCARNVKIELYPDGKGEPVYSSSVDCENGRFEFSDNLLQWSNLKDGEYEVSVNGDVQNIKKIKIERPVIQNNPVQAKEVRAAAPEASMSPQNKFLEAFVSLQQSILDMRAWLSETNYSAFIKAGINLALNGVDHAVGKVSELVLSGENGDVGSDVSGEVKEQTVDVIEAQVPAGNISDPVQSQLQQEFLNIETSETDTEKLSIPNSDISEIDQ